MNIEYDDFIKMVNNHKIKFVNFYIYNYSHYNNCNIYTKSDTLKNGNIIYLILFNLTNDKKEDVSFLKKLMKNTNYLKLKKVKDLI